MYLEQDRAENAQTKKNVSIHRLKESVCSTEALEETHIENEEKRNVMIAADKLFREGMLTEKQKRRFILHYFYGLTTRRIGTLENTSHVAAAKSIRKVTEKLKKYFFERD